MEKENGRLMPFLSACVAVTAGTMALLACIMLCHGQSCFQKTMELRIEELERQVELLRENADRPKGTRREWNGGVTPFVEKRRR